ncbi:hypothetical protein [Gracilimonas tropica]|uniref:hypothetical protein n=1 Tax=Gracilimonas tropica TaxID=454600 RepID=UPI00037145BD|nr:hypothetical protein [Gracilimonas tropica]
MSKAEKYRSPYSSKATPDEIQEERSQKENTAQDLINFEKQLSKFEKDTLTTYMASLAVDWSEEQQDAFIAGLCMIEEMITPKNTETGASDSTPGQPASATDELTK